MVHLQVRERDRERERKRSRNWAQICCVIIVLKQASIPIFKAIISYVISFKAFINEELLNQIK